MFIIRKFNSTDAKETYQLFYDTVHAINSRDYTQEQVDVWAPKDKNIEEWCVSLLANYAFVAVLQENEKIVGFADMDNTGYLNRGYVHQDYQGQGIGKALLDIRIQQAKSLKLDRVFSNVSITAKPFFEKNAFQLIQQQIRIFNGVEFINFRMEKIIT